MAMTSDHTTCDHTNAKNDIRAFMKFEEVGEESPISASELYRQHPHLNRSCIHDALKELVSEGSIIKSGQMGATRYHLASHLKSQPIPWIVAGVGSPEAPKGYTKEGNPRKRLPPTRIVSRAQLN